MSGAVALLYRCPVLAGTCQLQYRYKQYPSRGQHTVTLDGTAIGGTIDQYGASSAYLTTTLGTVTFTTTGVHVIRLNVTGKNASSTAFTFASDSFTFAPN